MFVCVCMCSFFFLISVNELMFWCRMHLFYANELVQSRDLGNQWKCKTALTLPTGLYLTNCCT